MSHALLQSGARHERTLVPGASCTRRRPAAFTLMELVLSMGLLSLILGAVTAVVSLAARTAPHPDDPLASTIALQAIADQIMLDCGDASEIEMIGKHEIILTCDDITGDGTPDTIRYAWSGNAGDPLVRSLNGVDRVLSEGLNRLAFAAEGILTHTSAGTTTVTQTDQLVAAVSRIGTTGNATKVRTNAVAQRFKARVPSDAESWSLRSVVLWLERDGLPESTGAVQIWTDGGTSPGTLVSQRTFAELALAASAGPETFAFSLPGLDPDDAYWIVVRSTLLASSCAVLESPDAVASDDESVARLAGGSTVWIPSSDASLFFEVRGDVVLTQPTMRVDSRATALFVNLSTEAVAAAGGVRLAHRPLLIADADAVVEVGAPDTLLDTIGEGLADVIDATGGLLGGLLGGGGR